MLVTKRYAQKILRERKVVKCHVCGEEIRSGDRSETYEYVKTKNGNDIFIHKCCMKRW